MIIIIVLLVLIIVLLLINASLHTKTEEELENGIKAREEGLKSITNLNSHLVDMLLRQNNEQAQSSYFITEDVLKELLTKTNTKTDENAIHRTIKFLKENLEIKG
jgi:hypothetical protein